MKNNIDNNIEQVRTNIKQVIAFYQSLGKSVVYNNRHFYEHNSDTYVFPRLDRAASNQAENNATATCSRYAIWAADVRELIEEAIQALNEQDVIKAKENLNLAFNALGAYIDIQSIFDALPGGMQFKNPEEIIKGYKKFLHENKFNNI